MDNIQILTIILTVVLGTMVILLLSLGAIYVMLKVKKQKNETENKKANAKNETSKTEASKNKKYKEYTIHSINDFMEFDTVVDNMISQKNGMRYIMVVACQGVNYDLMSEAEKNAVEEGFIQFLNTIRHPIQIYTQTRTINLEDSVNKYKEKVRQIETTLNNQQIQYEGMLNKGTYTNEEINKAYFELTKRRNLYEYGKDIIFDTEKMSLNKNILSQKYYIVIPYYIEDIGEGKFAKEELCGLAFDELYTRAQTVIRTLSACGVSGKIMTSNELIELLYMAYNRDDAEIYGIDKALKAGYDELYTTAPDVIDKKMRELDRQIEASAMEKAKNKITQVKSEKQKKYEEKKDNLDDLIDELAKLIIEQNKNIIGEEVAQKAIKKIDDEVAQKPINKMEEEGGVKNVQKQKTNRTRKTKQVK